MRISPCGFVACHLPKVQKHFERPTENVCDRRFVEVLVVFMFSDTLTFVSYVQYAYCIIYTIISYNVVLILYAFIHAYHLYALDVIKLTKQQVRTVVYVETDNFRMSPRGDNSLQSIYIMSSPVPDTRRKFQSVQRVCGCTYYSYI